MPKNGKLKSPTSNLSLVLYYLIHKGKSGLSERQSNQNGFRARLSELRLDYGLIIDRRKVDFKNVFNHASTYTVHFIKNKNRAKAIAVYKELIEKKH